MFEKFKYSSFEHIKIIDLSMSYDSKGRDIVIQQFEDLFNINKKMWRSCEKTLRSVGFFFFFFYIYILFKK